MKRNPDSSGRVASERVGRRGFFGGATAIAAAAVAAPIAASPAAASETDAEKKKARYQESDHVKAYYRTNRY